MNQQVLVIAPALALFVAAGSAQAQASEPVEPRYEWFRDLDIEAVVAQSELILVTRIDEIKELPLPVGGKGENAMLQIRFEPVRVLKGVFAREALTLTSYDLGISRLHTGLDRLRVGDLRLLLLGRSQSGYQNRNVAPDVDRSLLPLRNEQDPLTATVSTLLAVHAAPNRDRRVTLLTEAVTGTRGAAVVPLLHALPRRALLAAQRDATLTAIAPHLTDASPAIRVAAGDALRAILSADYLEQGPMRERVASALAAALRLEQPNAAARMALIGAAGELGPAGRSVVPPLSPGALLTIERAQIHALGRLGKETARFESVLASLPLDHPNAVAYETEFARADPEAAARLIPQRARLKLAAGLSVEEEVYSTTAMPLEHSVATLGQLASLALNARERHAFAMAASQISARTAKHPALLPLTAPLATMLDPGEGQTRYVAVSALINIDTPAAARALQPHLREETDLSRKLQMAEFLGRHGIRDGYPYAIEHMSESQLLEQAVAALAAIGDPRAIEESRRILETSNDKAWNVAAIRVLGAMDARTMAPQFLKIIEGWRNPLAPAALIALGDLGEREALPAAQDGLGSRNDEIVVAAARAAGKLIKAADHDATDLRDALAALVADAGAAEPMRAAALESLVLIGDPRLDAALTRAVIDAGLEGTELMARIEELLRERKVRLVAS